MNYQDFVHTHRQTGADITVAALPTDEKQATAFGLMKIDETGRIQVTVTTQPNMHKQCVTQWVNVSKHGLLRSLMQTT